MDMSGFFDMDKMAAAVNRVKAAVMNYPEFEAKVREATNNDPYPDPDPDPDSDLTRPFAFACCSRHGGHFADIMRTISMRLQEPPSATWRQTYKALQLLEYLIKNGSERVVDSARANIYELRALLNYNYIDDKKKDQGMNIKNRAKEIIELLESDEKIRLERVKARGKSLSSQIYDVQNRAKYVGVSSTQMAAGGFSSGFSNGSGSGDHGGFGGSGKKYGGFGPGSGSFSSGGGSSGTSGTTSFQDNAPRNNYDSLPAPVSQRQSGSKPASQQQQPAKKQQPQQPTAPQTANLLDVGGDDDWSDFSAAPSQPASKPATTAFQSGLDNDFADFSGFQSAPAATTAAAMPTNQQPAVGFASFGGQTQQQYAPPVPAASGFASFAAFPSAMPPTSFAAFPQTSQQPSATTLQQPMVAAPPVSAYSTTSAPTVQGSDPFSRLVSLDPMSLSTPSKREDRTGPSLNALGSAGGAGTGTGTGMPGIPMLNPALVGAPKAAGQTASGSRGDLMSGRYQ
eukprot:jgi/Hompol1/1426/HPOL_001387-RA